MDPELEAAFNTIERWMAEPFFNNPVYTAHFQYIKKEAKRQASLDLEESCPIVIHTQPQLK